MGHTHQAPPGELLRATLALRGLNVTACQGPIPGARNPRGGAVWAADDAAFKARYQRAGVDVLMYDDAPAKSLWWDSNTRQVTDEIGIGINHLHVPNMMCWRLIKRARAGCTHREKHSASHPGIACRHRVGLVSQRCWGRRRAGRARLGQVVEVPVRPSARPRAAGVHPVHRQGDARAVSAHHGRLYGSPSPVAPAGLRGRDLVS